MGLSGEKILKISNYPKKIPKWFGHEYDDDYMEEMTRRRFQENYLAVPILFFDLD